jgi:hypothetical protein
MEYLEAQVRLLTAKRFGTSSEKTPVDQLSLFGDAFNEAEATAQPFAPEPDLGTIEVTGHKRKKKRTRDELLQGLPENIIHHHLSEEEMVCSCGHPRHVIRQEVSRELRIVPAQFWVDVHNQVLRATRLERKTLDSTGAGLIGSKIGWCAHRLLSFQNK